ncbi:protein translocase subunit SecD [Sporichthya polymorpha]|uniref:protein translocase subunit SecD n=1 Tax=Sporichthya polymorpha TaxID=35751 RepID=UPI0003A44777|nr:protein translocase subunit SecD [Sporichthya polymorpha]
MSTSKGAARGGMSPLRALALTLALLVGGLITMFGVGAMSPKLAIDLAGGTSVTLTAKPLPEAEGGKGGGITGEAMNQAVSIIRQRVNGFGVSEAQVTTLGSDNIVVSVPGQNNSRIVEQVGQTALLRFRPVLQVGGAQPSTGLPGLPDLGELTEGLGQTPSPNPSAESNRAVAGALRAADDPSPSPTASARPSKTPKAGGKTDGKSDGASDETPGTITQAVRDEFAALNCLDPAARQGGDQAPAEAVVVACDKDGTAKYILGPSEVQGTQITKAEAGLPQGAGVGNWLIQMEFDGAGTSAFARLTRSLAGQTPPANQLAIVLDGVVYSSPQVSNEIPTGQAEITGNFTSQTANDLANVLKYGALPLAFEKSTVTTISATVGDDQLQGGLIAGAIGMVLVVVYSTFYYRGLGLMALAGLLVAAAMAWITVSLLGEAMGYRLSLAGVAGLIVAIGITADSFVVYFERLRDEIRDGRSPRTAAEYGWLRARRTILSANFVSLLAAGVLYYFSVADVKGFAFTLGVMTIIDVIVIVLFTKPLISLAFRHPYFARAERFSGVNRASLGMRPAVAAPAGGEA